MIRTPVCDLLDIEHPIALGGMGSIYSPDLVYVHTTGDRDTKESYLAALESRYVYYLHLHRENEAIVVQGDAAIAAGRQIGLSVLNGNPGLIDSLYLAVYARNESGQWQFLAWHANKYSPTARV